jgi:hypothetical protein
MIPDPASPAPLRLLLKPHLEVITKDGEIYVRETVDTYCNDYDGDDLPSEALCLIHRSTALDFGPLTDTDQAKRFVAARERWLRGLQEHASGPNRAVPNTWHPFTFEGKTFE